MKPSMSSWKSRFRFSRSKKTSASVLTRRGQVADRTQTAPLTLPQTLPAQEGWKCLSPKKDGGLLILKENEASMGNFLRFGGRDN
jgi:hypothetical protein